MIRCVAPGSERGRGPGLFGLHCPRVLQSGRSSHDAVEDVLPRFVCHARCDDCGLRSATARGPSSVVTGVLPAAEGLAAKPGASTEYITTFSGGITGTGPLSGSTSGTEGTPGTLRAQLSGRYSWTIGPLEKGGDCEGNGLTIAASGLVGPTLSGSLTLDADERNSFGERVTFRMTGVQTSDGKTWDIRVDTVGYPVTISGTPDAMLIDVPFTVIGFTRIDRNKAVETIRCAVKFGTKITYP